MDSSFDLILRHSESDLCEHHKSTRQKYGSSDEKKGPTGGVTRQAKASRQARAASALIIRPRVLIRVASVGLVRGVCALRIPYSNRKDRCPIRLQTLLVLALVAWRFSHTWSSDLAANHKCNEDARSEQAPTDNSVKAPVLETHDCYPSPNVMERRTPRQAGCWA